MGCRGVLDAAPRDPREAGKGLTRMRDHRLMGTEQTLGQEQVADSGGHGREGAGETALDERDQPPGDRLANVSSYIVAAGAELDHWRFGGQHES